MSYSVKTEDLTKAIGLILTAEQLETIAGALEMYCIGLSEHNDKDKAYKKIVPRGKVFSRLHKQEWNAVVKVAKSLSTKWQKIET